MKFIAKPMLELLVLEHLPAAPNGLSISELADGLLSNAGPAGRGKIKAALDKIATFVGGVSITRGDDFLGHFDVMLFGLPPEVLSFIRQAWPALQDGISGELSTYVTSGDFTRPDEISGQE